MPQDEGSTEAPPAMARRRPEYDAALLGLEDAIRYLTSIHSDGGLARRRAALVRRIRGAVLALASLTHDDPPPAHPALPANGVH